MFIWVAINVEKQLKHIKDEARIIEKMVGFDESSIDSLPLHISLKISTKIEDEMYDEIVSDISSIYRTIKPFDVEVEEIELHDTICWIKMKENEELDLLHQKMNNLFFEKYHLPLHKFDLEFKFHSTLFLDSNASKVKEAFLKIKDIDLPKVVTVNRFIIGGSKDGTIGSYRVFKEIEI